MADTSFHFLFCSLLQRNPFQACWSYNLKWTKPTVMKFREIYIYISIYCTEITEINLSTFVYRLFHEDFSSLVGTNLLNHFPALYIYIDFS